MPGCSARPATNRFGRQERLAALECFSQVIEAIFNIVPQLRDSPTLLAKSFSADMSSPD
jgi:hypothetical protein